MSDTPTTAAWLKRHSGEVRRPIGLAIGVEWIGGVLLIIQAALLAHVADAVIFEHAALASVIWALTSLGGVMLVRAALTYVSERLRFLAAAQIKRSMRARLLERIENLGLGWQRRVQSGDVVNTLTDGVEQLEAFYGRYLPQSALAVLVPLAILVVIAPIDWLSGIILIVTAPLIPVFMILIGKGAEKLNQRQWRRMGVLSGHFLDALQGLTTLRIFNLGKREARLIERLSDDYRKSTMAVLRVAFLSSLILEFLATVSIALVAVLIGFRLLWGEIGFEAGFLVLLLAPEFYLPLRNMGGVYHARMEAIGAAEQMVELMYAPALDWQGTRRDVPRTGVPAIALEQVTFTYPDSQAPALNAVDLRIAPGETVAVVGPSGAGKSTLALLLLGLLRAQHGRITIDDVPLDAVDIDHWRTQTAWVSQQPRLFYGTIADNLRLGRPDADDDALWKALQRAQAYDFVAALPAGLDTEIGERGLRLSGGEGQRLAIARALLRDAPFVVVDEVSAHLDADNERRLVEALAELSQGRSMLVVAHRLASIAHADRIVVLDNGRVGEQGSEAELLAANGLYATLARRRKDLL